MSWHADPRRTWLRLELASFPDAVSYGCGYGRRDAGVVWLESTTEVSAFGHAHPELTAELRAAPAFHHADSEFLAGAQPLPVGDGYRSWQAGGCHQGQSAHRSPVTTPPPSSTSPPTPWYATKQGNRMFGWTAVVVIGGLVLFLMAIPVITGAPAPDRSNSPASGAPALPSATTPDSATAQGPSTPAPGTGSAFGIGQGSAMLVWLSTGQPVFTYDDCNAMFDELNARADSGTTESDRSAFIAGCQAFDGNDHVRPSEPG